MSIEQKYKKLDNIDHILLRPNVYIGSVKTADETLFIYNKDEKCMEFKQVKYNPGLLKIINEVLDNSIDHSIRDKTVKNIEINVENDHVSIFNDGTGIEIVKHKEYELYIPELIFGNLFSSSNYSDDDRNVIGQNGLGVKLANIFSKKFIIETADKNFIYYQEWSDNMKTKSSPKIIKNTNKSQYTKVTFYPEFNRFGLKLIKDNDNLDVFYKRIMDSSFLIRKNITIKFNNEVCKRYNLAEYTKLYLNNSSIIYTDSLTSDNEWEISICTNSPYDSFLSESCINNSINTYSGGKHVDHIINTLVKKISDYIKTKKKNITIKPSYIKDKLFILLKASVKNPEFESQCKNKLTTPINKFGYKPEISDKLVELISKELITYVLEISKFKESQELNKSLNNSTRRKKNLIIAKLDDAIAAGTKDSNKCSLFLTEGLSAKTLILAGLKSSDKKYIGCFPLRGKFLNIQNATKKQLETNEEIKNVLEILGLKVGVENKIKQLRYGNVYLMSDQDTDGFHIRGLLINFFKMWFPNLLKEDFIKVLKTPIIRMNAKTKNLNDKLFYQYLDFENFKKENETLLKKYNIRYLKGLGSSSKKDAKEYFSNIEKLTINYIYDKDTEENIDLAFSKNTIAERKDWILNYDRNNILDYSSKEITFSDFIDKELIHFSNYDNIRSIPNIVDGFKPSQRKTLFGCFKKGITNKSKSIKVAQLSAYIAEVSDYHHGEISLQMTLISMAQDFVGSNNINLLVPEGQFGSRLSNGDSASPRYIYTYLNDITQLIFNKKDFNVLKYLKDDDNREIEPEYYCPIIPTVLINGSLGIGTGFSTNIPMYNPKDIIDNLLMLLSGSKNLKKMLPWFSKHKGEIKIYNDKLCSFGIYKKITNNKIQISELPIKVFKDDYKSKILDKFILEKNYIKAYDDYSTDTDILFEVEFISEEILNNLIENDSIYKIFKLYESKSLSTSNMYLFDHKGKLKKYNSPENILYSFYQIRIIYYKKRREYILNELNETISFLSNKMKFIQMIIDEELIIKKRKKNDIISNLEQFGFDKRDNNYNYLLNMSLMTLTWEEYEKLRKNIEELNQEYKLLLDKTEKDLYKDDLFELQKEYEKFIKN